MLDAKLIEQVMALRERVRETVVAKVDVTAFGCVNCADDPRARELRDLVADTVLTLSSEANLTLDRATVQSIVANVVNDLAGYGPISELLTDPTISEIMVNGPREVFVEREGKLYETDQQFRDEAHLRQVAERIVSPVGRRLDDDSPYVDARLPDGSRANIIIPPIAFGGTVLTIRKFTERRLTLARLIETGTLTKPAADFLAGCVKGKLNLLVSGGTGSGKTTMLNVLAQTIPPEERLVTVEDAVELQLRRKNLAALEVRPANVDGRGQVTARDLVRNALRMRPDRIIVGEVRGPETLEMLQAMNTGHEGSMSTVHANTPRDALSRLETMIMMAGLTLSLEAVRAQIAAALHLLVHLERLPGGRRALTRICEVQGMEGATILIQDIFTLSGGTETGRLQATGLVPKFNDLLKTRGIEFAPGLFRHANG